MDDRYEEAKKIIVGSSQPPMISHLMRTMGIGYNWACDMMRRMTEEGILIEINNKLVINDGQNVLLPEPSNINNNHVRTCLYCNEAIPLDMVQQGGLHIGCYETEIDVFFVSLPGAPKCGYYERDINVVAEMLKESDGQYLIERQEMPAGRYYNLPDFEGF